MGHKTSLLEEIKMGYILLHFGYLSCIEDVWEVTWRYLGNVTQVALKMHLWASKTMNDVQWMANPVLCFFYFSYSYNLISY